MREREREQNNKKQTHIIHDAYAFIHYISKDLQLIDNRFTIVVANSVFKF